MTFNIVFNIDINLTHIQTVQYFDNMCLAKDVPRTIIINQILILPTMCQTYSVVITSINDNIY